MGPTVTPRIAGRPELAQPSAPGGSKCHATAFEGSTAITMSAAIALVIGASLLRSAVKGKRADPAKTRHTPRVAHVVLYTTPFCPYCHMAKRLFKGKGVEFEEINVAGDTQKRAWLRTETGQHTVPQIFIEGKSYGGYSDVSSLDERNGLEPLLAPR